MKNLLLLLSFLLVYTTSLFSQCTFSAAWGSGNAPADGSSVTLSTCVWAGERTATFSGATTAIEDSQLGSLDEQSSPLRTKSNFTSDASSQKNNARELINRRGMFEKHFINNKGSVDMKVSSEPLHFWKNNKWNAISTKIEEFNDSVYIYANLDNLYENYYPKDINSGLKAIMNNQVILEFMNPHVFGDVDGEKHDSIKAVSSSANLSGNILYYPAVYGELVDLKITQKAGKRKLEYVIKDKSFVEAFGEAEYLVFSEDIQLPDGWIAELRDNTIYLYDSDSLVGAYEYPMTYDSKSVNAKSIDLPDRSNRIDNNCVNNVLNNTIYVIEQNGRVLNIQTKVKMSYLLSSDLVYPVHVDPSLTASAGMAGWFYTSNAGPNGHNPITTSGAPQGSQVTTVDINLTVGLLYECCWWNNTAFHQQVCGDWHIWGISKGNGGFLGFCPPFNGLNNYCGQNPNDSWRVWLLSADGFTYASQFAWTLTINYEETPQISANSSSVCVGDPVSISGNNNFVFSDQGQFYGNYWLISNNGGANWAYVNGLEPDNNPGALFGAPSFNSAPVTAFTLTFNTPGTYTIMREHINGCAVAVSNQIVITVAEPYTPPNISGGGTFCLGDEVNLSASGSNAPPNQWTWHENNANNPSLATGASFTVIPSVSTSYVVTVPGNGACSSGGTSNPVNVNINQPNPVISVANNSAVAGDYIWNGQVSNDWNDANNWYQKTTTGYIMPSIAPALSDNVFVVPSSVAGNCISSSNTPVVNVLTLGSGTAQDVFIHQDSELALDNNTILEVTGDFYSFGQFTAGLNSVVEFKGGADTKVAITNPHQNKFYNIAMNKSNAWNEVELESNIHVENEVSFTLGNIKLDQFTLDLETTGFFAGESELSYAYCDCPTGRIIRTVPIGANTTVNAGNLGIAITPAVNMGTVKVERYHETIIDPNNNMPQSIVRYFSVKDENGGPVQNNGNLDADVVVHYLDAELNGLIGTLSLFHRAGGQNFWDEYGGVHDATAKTVSYEGFPSFSDVTLSPLNSPLPVKLTLFTTECDNGIPVLKWTTESEQNSDYFQIERSRDGFDWIEVSKVEAMGNSNTTKNYQFYDMTSGYFEGYYRLKQVDFDGKFEYFGPVSSFCSDYKNEFISEVFPNPTTGEVFIGIRNNIEENVNILLTDFSGRLLKDINFEVSNGYTLKTIDLLGYSSGSYLITIITNNNNKYVHKIIVK